MVAGVVRVGCGRDEAAGRGVETPTPVVDGEGDAAGGVGGRAGLVVARVDAGVEVGVSEGAG